MRDERELHASTMPTGQRRTLSVSINAGTPPRLVFTEKYTGEGTGWLSRFASFGVEAAVDADPAPLLDAVAGLAGAGKLDLPPMGARERVADLLAAAGLLLRRQSTVPWVHLGKRATLTITPDGRPPAITFAGYTGEGRHHVVTAYDSLDRITEHLAPRYPGSTVDVAPRDRIGRFIAAFTAFAGDSPTAEQIRQLYAEIGVDAETRDEHRYPLLHTERKNTRCLFSLSLLVSGIENKISFTEHYEYLPQPGDSGREYAYSAVTPYASLEPLAAHLEARLGGPAGDGAGSTPDRLAACLRALVARGELSATGPIEACRDQVAEWYTEAGVPCTKDVWVWFESD